MNNQKVIVFSIGSLARGGAERVVLNLAQYFQEIGYKTYLITQIVAQEEYEVPSGIIRIVADLTMEEVTQSRIKNFIRRILKLRTTWKKYQPDVILSFIGKNNFMNIVSTRGLNIPVVVTVCSAPRSEYEGRLNWLLANILFRQANGVVLKTKEAILEFPRKIQKKSCAMPNPLNEQFVMNQLPKLRKKEIAAVGRVDENKNHKLLIDAFAEVTEQYSDWSCSIYGEGDCKDNLEHYIQTLGIENKIRMCGKHEKIAEAIKESSIYVLTSRVEGMPNALMEGMALGLACISTDCPCGGPRELINHGENGFLFPVDDKDKLVELLCDLLEDESLRREIGEKAWRSMEFSHPQKVCIQWQEYLESLLNV